MRNEAEVKQESISDLEKLRTEVIVKRAGLAVEMKILQEANASLERSPEWTYLQYAHDQVKMVSGKCAAAEDALRAAAEENYRVNGEKKPVCGVEIKIAREVVYEAEKALTWCMMSAQALIEHRLKAAEFKKGVREGVIFPPKEIAHVSEEPKAYLSKDMG